MHETDDYRAKAWEHLTQTIDPMVKKAGWAVQWMLGDQDNPSFSYTIGLSAKQLPELLITLPIEPELARYILNNVAKTFIKLGSAAAGDLHQVLEGLPVRVSFIDMSAFAQFGKVAVAWAQYRRIFLNQAMQVILPDEYGNFPGDDAYAWVPQLVLPGPQTTKPEKEPKT